jgi:hypothetical protein
MSARSMFDSRSSGSDGTGMERMSAPARTPRTTKSAPHTEEPPLEEFSIEELEAALDAKRRSGIGAMLAQRNDLARELRAIESELAALVKEAEEDAALQRVLAAARTAPRPPYASTYSSLSGSAPAAVAASTPAFVPPPPPGTSFVPPPRREYEPSPRFVPASNAPLAPGAASAAPASREMREDRERRIESRADDAPPPRAAFAPRSGMSIGALLLLALGTRHPSGASATELVEDLRPHLTNPRPLPIVVKTLAGMRANGLVEATPGEDGGEESFALTSNGLERAREI